jgi:hypothetical protein
MEGTLFGSGEISAFLAIVMDAKMISEIRKHALIQIGSNPSAAIKLGFRKAIRPP